MVWLRFRLLRRYLALWPAEVGRIYRILGMVGEGCPGHGPLHLLSASAAEIVVFWDPGILAWVMPGLPPLSHLAGLVQHFNAAILDAWRDKVSVDLCGRKGFRGGHLLDIHGSLQLLTSSHVRERDKALLRTILVGGVWNGFLLGRVRSQFVPCRFCGAPDGDGHLFWECTFPPLVEIRENPEFHDLIRMDKGHWPHCLLWHGWLPKLSGVNGASTWAADASESAFYLVETDLGQYSAGLVSEWSLSGLLVLLIVPLILLNLRLAGILLVFLLNGVSLLSLMLLRLPLCFLTILMSGLMVALFLIGLLVCPLLALGSLLISLLPVGIIDVGVMLIRFARLVIFSDAGDFLLFLGLSSLFSELSYGVCPLVLSILVSII